MIDAVRKQFEDSLVSVIIPVFNVQKYISRTLDSVLAQTYHNIEIVTVDDCSTDKTAAIIKQYQKQYPQILYHYQEKNQGAGIARNKALEIARGQYVAFLDSDDEWKPEKLEKQISLLQEKKGGFCYAAIEMIDEDGKLVKEKREVRESVDYNFLLRNTIIATSSVVIDRELMGDFRMHIRRGGQDYATWLKLLRDGTIAYGINEVMVRYRLRKNSLAANKLDSVRQIWEIQTKNERINQFIVASHIFQWGCNVMRKYFL